MEERRMISAGKQAFGRSEHGRHVEGPFVDGFVRGVRFYANHLFRKSLIQIVRSILDTRDSTETRNLENEEYVILFVLRNYGRLLDEKSRKDEMIERLTLELSQERKRRKDSEERLARQIKDLEYWLSVVGGKHDNVNEECFDY